MSSPLTSTEWAGFVHAIRFAPDDDTPRLVAADWLQDTNSPELMAWADFIRFQCDSARERRLHVYSDSCDCGGCRPERRSAMLFDRYGQHWAWHLFGHLPTTPQMGNAGDFVRGFLASATITIKDWVVAEVPGDIHPIYTRTPIPRVHVYLKQGLSNNNWFIEIVTRPNSGSPYASIIASIIPQPMPAQGREYRSSRVISPHNNFARSIRGTVRTVIKNRTQCFPQTA